MSGIVAISGVTGTVRSCENRWLRQIADVQRLQRLGHSVRPSIQRLRQHRPGSVRDQFRNSNRRRTSGGEQTLPSIQVGLQERGQ